MEEGLAFATGPVGVEAQTIMNWRRWLSILMTAGMLSNVASGQSPTGRGGNLKVTAIDVEGGQATLFVTPAGQSLLIDTG